MDIEHLFNEARSLHQQGNFEKAQSLYKKILKRSPAQPDVLQLLGVLEAQNKRFDAALQLFRRSIALDPRNANARSNFGNVLREIKRYQEALDSFDNALAINPNHVDAHAGKGSALVELGRPDEAIESFAMVLAVVPNHPAALVGHGTALCLLGRHEEGIADFDRVLTIVPRYAEALCNRGKALREVKRYQEAISNYEMALSIRPDYAEALYNLGNVLLDLRRHEEAIAVLNRLLALNNSYPGALLNLGNALFNLRRYDDALESYARILRSVPDHIEALKNRSVALIPLERYADAAADLRRLIALQPDYEYAKGELLHANMHCCDWENFESDVADCVNEVRRGHRAITPFAFQAICNSPEDSLRCSQIYADDKYPGLATFSADTARSGHRKIRIGYVSGEFRSHATSHLLIGLLEHHDRTAFDLYAFDNGYADLSPVRLRIERAVDRVIDISRMTDDDAAALIKKENIDILVDLNGYFGYGRAGIFSRRASPVQVNYLGFPATLGANYYDYIIADRHVIKADEERFYSEKVACLPDCYQANDVQRPIAELSVTRQEAGLPENDFVFCCFNNSYKITPVIFDVWMRLLRKVPGSVLWLLKANDDVSKNLVREAEKRGIRGERLVFAERAKPDAHLARHKLADLFIDTLPYNAHTTASDALWGGLPLLTCVGGTFPGRVAASLLNSLGMPELVTSSLHDYEALALKCATDKTFLETLRSKLALNRTRYPLFNTARFCKHIEQAYSRMWSRCLEGKCPEGFVVEPSAEA